MLFFHRLMPFIGLGVFLVLFAIGIWLALHLLVIGAIIGLILYVAVAIKNALFPSKIHKVTFLNKRRGRIFDHDNK